MARLDVLRTGSWKRIVLSDTLECYPTMLAHDERRLLLWLARDVWDGWGAIVDAGCFLGGSTVSFATGLAERPSEESLLRPGWPLATYDRFEVEDYALQDGYFTRWRGLAPGESFRPAFDQMTAGMAHHVSVHEGDITLDPWLGAPIEILFLDVLKTPAVNDAVCASFMPALQGGRSIIVQQDYVHGMLPWIHITMELLADCVEVIEDVWGSRVYAVTRDITAEQLSEVLPLADRVSASRQRELMHDAVEAASGATRGMLRLAQANLLGRQGDTAAAAAIVDDVERAWRDDAPIMHDVRSTRTALALGARAG